MIKHSLVGLVGTSISISASYYLVNKNFKTSKITIPHLNLVTVTKAYDELSDISTNIVKLKKNENLNKFEAYAVYKPDSFFVKKEVHGTKVEKQIEKKYSYKNVTKKQIVKNENVRSAKLSLKEMTKKEIKLKDSIHLPSHKGIELYGFKVNDEIKSINMASIWQNTQVKLATLNNIKVDEDRISTALAATEKSPSKMTTQNDNGETNQEIKEDKMNSNSLVEVPKNEEDQNEPVLFDYATSPQVVSNETSLQTNVKEFQKPKKSNEKVLKNAKVPSTVTATNVQTNKAAADDLVMFDLEKVKEDLKKTTAKVTKNDQVKKESVKEETNDIVVYDLAKKNDYSVCSEEKARQVYSTSLSISPRLVNIGSSKVSKLENFEVKFKDDVYNSLYSTGSDPVVVEADLNGVMNIRRATIFSKDIMPTTTDLAFELEPVVVNMPTVSRDSFDNLVRSENLRAQGGHILVELDDMTETVDILSDTAVEKKLYLDKNYRVVNRGDSEYSYVLFIGVSPGNTILTYKTWKNEKTSKIIHVSSDEIFYDFNLYIEESQDKFEICEESVLSKKPTQYYVNSNDIKSFSFDAKIKNLGLNTLGTDRSVLPLGTRKYYAIKDSNETLFAGRFENEQIILPSLVYRSFVLENFGLRKLGNQCIVQVNLKKAATAINFEGESEKGYMRVDKLLLDRDGQFYDDFSETTQKIFFLGENQGIINLKIDYADNSHDYLMTYCSDSTYLVEQL